MRRMSVATETIPGMLWRRIRWFVRDRWPDRTVVRQVQGVKLYLPWSHRLPDYAHYAPDYGQNLIQFAALLSAPERPLTFLDVGANVGDSTLQLLRATDASVLCVEADSYFVSYLRRNVDHDPRVTIDVALLAAAETHVDMAPVRSGGTTRFAPGQSELTAPTVSTDELRRRHAQFDDLRLVKSDTDGYDVVLIPAIARTWSSSRPALFFEYDPRLSRLADNDPMQVWPALAELGYSQVLAWDNAGRLVGHWKIDEMADRATSLEVVSDDAGSQYWDVAVAHDSDQAARAALTAMAQPLTQQ